MPSMPWPEGVNNGAVESCIEMTAETPNRASKARGCFKLPRHLRAAESKETPFNFPGRIHPKTFSQHLRSSQWRSHLGQGMARATIAL